MLLKLKSNALIWLRKLQTKYKSYIILGPFLIKSKKIEYQRLKTIGFKIKNNFSTASNQNFINRQKCKDIFCY